jgi:hypothetical protein
MEFRIHLGAHKTATTQFQDILEIVFREKKYDKVEYLPRDELRREKFVKYGVNAGSVPRIQRLARGFGLYRKPMLASLVSRFDNDARVLISEENILGGVNDMLGGFYQGAGPRISSLKDMVRDNRARIYLSVRNYTDILPSAYCQSLRGGATPHLFDFYKSGFLNSDCGWPALVEQCLKVFARQDVTVWTFDTYTKNPLAIVEMFSGLSLHFDHEIPKSEQVTRLTQAQISEIERYLSKNNNRISKEKLRQILSDQRGGDLYAPLSREERSLFDARYQRDLDRIRNLGVAVL